MAQDALRSILTELGHAFGPLEKIKTPADAQELFGKLGYELPIDAIGNKVTSLVNKASAVGGATEILSDGEGDMIAAADNLASCIAETVQAMFDFYQQMEAALNAAPPAKLELDEFPRRLTDYLILEYLDTKHHEVHSLFHVLGLVEFKPQPAPDKPRRVVNWEHFGKIFSDPSQIAKDVYGWGKQSPAIHELLDRLKQLLLPTTAPRALQPTYAAPAALDNPLANLEPVSVPIFQKGSNKFELEFSPIDGAKGLKLTMYWKGENKVTVPIERGELHFQSTSPIDDVGIALRSLPIQAEVVKPPGLPASFRAVLEIEEKSLDTELILVGSPGGTRLALQGLTTNWFVEQAQGKVDLGVEAAIKALRLKITGGEGDGFLQTILSSLHVEIETALTLGMTFLQGFTIGGGAKLAIDLAIHQEIGPLNIKNLRLTLGLAGDQLNLDVGVLFSVNLGPLQASIENMGLRATLHLPQGQRPDAAGLTVGFKPPNGVGLALDAGVIKGGGYLYFDTEREEYAGALELVFSGTITLKAIGLITTRMPDGSKGFSLLIIISAEFGTGIQLGYGFTLLAVGGLLGLNRAMRLDALTEGIRTGSINSIMFPENVIENAPRIISDLRTIFPPEEGKFLIGPMVKIGWGTPTLISISFGLIIEIPGNLAIIGVLKVALPTVDKALVVLQVNFVGAIEFDRKRLYFFASLFESHVLSITLEGELGLLMAFGDDANFVLSVGGFHPAYQPPPLPFPSPKRLSFNILNESWGRIRVKGYFAITSNTVQFGAKAELFFGFSAFNINGHVAFDALFQFSPFRFIISTSASVSLTVFGVDALSISLAFMLEGPGHWRARGTAEVKILFIEISVDFDEEWGGKKHPSLPEIAVMPLLKAEFEKAENWRAVLPKGRDLLVTLRKVESTPDTQILHPVGTLQVSQRAVPLDLTIDKVGNHKVNDAKRLTVTVASADLGKSRDLNESFAIGQFQYHSDIDSLTRPSFEAQHGGVELSAQGAQLRSDRAVQRTVRYEAVIIDTNFKRSVRRNLNYNGRLFGFFLKGCSASRSSLSRTRKKQMQPVTQQIQVQGEKYVVALIQNNKPYRGSSSIFASEASAREWMRRQIDQDGELADSLHVIPAFEMNAA